MPASTGDQDESFLFTLRDLARRHPKVPVRKRLRDVADEIASAVTALADRPSKHAMQNLNGVWMRGVRTLDAAQAEMPSPGGPSGSLSEGARLAA